VRKPLAAWPRSSTKAGSVAAVDAAQALAELAELSSQVRTAVVLDETGTVLASTPADGEGVERLAASARDLLASATELHAGSEPTRAEVELTEGAVFVLREAGRTIAATTGPEPTSGLVVYDLRTCLQRMDVPKPRRRARKPKEGNPEP
jgi:predicted regulator of Ras-like GTPase activity (Roadblock/LC7/MglB family)